jgi:4-hydroxy-2-oxoheptanedioate aldolase
MLALRKRLVGDRPLIGTFVGIPSPVIVELLGWAGLDFALIDAEHSQIDRHDIEDLIRACDVADIASVVRVPSLHGEWIGSALDAGAQGVLVPRIGTAEEARAAVKAARYAPQGERGCGPGRAARYGMTLAQYLQTSNDELLLAIQVETAEGLANIEEIAAVEGVDLIFVGPGDLAVSLQAFGPEGRKRLDAAVQTITEVSKRHGKPVGIFHMNMSEIAGSVERGINFIAAAGDTLFFLRGLEATKAELGALYPQSETK